MKNAQPSTTTTVSAISERCKDALLERRAACLGQLDAFDKIARRSGLSGTQLFAIRIAVSQRSISSSRLCVALAIDTGAGSRMIETLVRAGLLQRDRHPRDRRLTMIAATRIGTELVEEVEDELIAALDTDCADGGV